MFDHLQGRIALLNPDTRETVAFVTLQNAVTEGVPPAELARLTLVAQHSTPDGTVYNTFSGKCVDLIEVLMPAFAGLGLIRMDELPDEYDGYALSLALAVAVPKPTNLMPAPPNEH